MSWLAAVLLRAVPDIGPVLAATRQPGRITTRNLPNRPRLPMPPTAGLSPSFSTGPLSNSTVVLAGQAPGGRLRTAEKLRAGWKNPTAATANTPASADCWRYLPCAGGSPITFRHSGFPISLTDCCLADLLRRRARFPPFCGPLQNGIIHVPSGNCSHGKGLNEHRMDSMSACAE